MKQIAVSLSDEERNKLIKIRSSGSRKVSEQCLCILLSDENNTVIDISQTLKRHPHTIRTWLKRYISQGISGLSRKFSPGRPSEKCDNISRIISGIIHKPPSEFGYQDSEWSIPLFAYHLHLYGNEKVCNDTVNAALKKLGYSYKRPSKAVSDKAPSKKEKAKMFNELLKKIQQIIEHNECEIFALDESHFSTEPYLVRGWFKKRWPPQNPNFYQKGNRHYVWFFESQNTTVLLETFEKIVS